MISRNRCFALLKTWTDRGWLRSLDYAFACFLDRQADDCPALVLLGAAMTSHQLGRGHVCLDLPAALADPDGTLSLPPEGEAGEDMPPKPSRILEKVTLSLWTEALSESCLVDTAGGAAPLVLSRNRLYLRRYWTYTRRVAAAILKRTGRHAPLPEDCPARLDALFDGLRTEGEKKKTEIHWQSVAAAVAAGSGFSVISGGPGTGKTTTVVQVLALVQAMAVDSGHPLRIRLAAPTGKAAARLSESMSRALRQLPEQVRDILPSAVTTLHRLLGTRPDSRRFIHGPGNPLHVDLLVVDEASMIDLEMMDALMGALPTKARLILLGDKDQLASVEAGSVLGDICANAACYRQASVQWIRRTTGYDVSGVSGRGSDLDQHVVVLRKSHRFHGDSGIGAMAAAVNQGRRDRVQAVWGKGYADICRVDMPHCDTGAFRRLVLDGSASAPSGKDDAPGGYRTYLEVLNQGPGNRVTEDAWLWEVLSAFNRFQLLTPLRRGEWGLEGLNRSAARVLFNAGLIPACDGWYAGRPVMVTRNDYSLGLMNGDVGIVAVLDGGEGGDRALRAVFPMADGSLKRVRPSRLGRVETVYAMTVHKSQGSEFDHAALVLPDTMSPVLTRELVYTGITRARSFFTLTGPDTAVLERAVAQKTMRASGLGDLLA